MDAIAVHVARDLHAAALREIIDQALVANIAVLEATLAGDERVDVARGELALAFDREIDARGEIPSGLLVLLEILTRAAEVFVDLKLSRFTQIRLQSWRYHSFLDGE